MKTLLLADDEKGYSELFNYLLKPAGYVITWVKNGGDAIEAVQKRGFDLIVLDTHMPGVKGPEVLIEIMRIRPGQKVVLFNSLSVPDHIFEEKMRGHGMLECLYKPVEVADIYRIAGVDPPSYKH